MLRFECDWCHTLKSSDEKWILGFAAENRGVTASRREVAILNGWDRERAVHPFAVHFCSIEHKDNYMAALFDTATKDEVKVRRVVPAVEQVDVRRRMPAKRTVIAHKRKAANSQPSPYGWRNRSDDPVYKKNLQRLIDRNEEFEDARK